MDDQHPSKMVLWPKWINRRKYFGLRIRIPCKKFKGVLLILLGRLCCFLAFLCSKAQSAIFAKISNYISIWVWTKKSEKTLKLMLFSWTQKKWLCGTTPASYENLHEARILRPKYMAGFSTVYSLRSEHHWLRSEEGQCFIHWGQSTIAWW